MSPFRWISSVLLVTVALALPGPAARAADLGPAPAPISPEDFQKRWEVKGGAYLWAAGLDGNMGVRGLGPFDTHLSFFDILEDLEFTVMAAGEARYDRFGLFADFIYMNLTQAETDLAGFIDANAGINMVAATAMGEFRVVEQGGSSIDVMAGARLWRVGGSVRLVGPGGGSVREADNEVWVDPMIGVKGRWKSATPFYATGWGMIGGFGIASDIDWDVMGAIGYEFNEHVSLLAGYRAAGVDYSNGGFSIDSIIHGPLVSGILRF
ncbi:hypothetical protein [Acuticoccus sp. I52.16.1]|uniref:hypothetical protein n=1 Tax=Acuticoccus sp. I52.16.1 TaxID=2928472 RepID=UPI001FD43CFF|nr:hypothetical protein [Acuticoccus sp. I52.16.1]UOM33629.1 hypothetical protein MRB58_17525 [Acuticoccus sp. I52.16.1]